MDLVARIDEMVAERSLLKHPFYQAWSDGKLTREALAGYSREYFQLVREVPSFMDSVMERAPDSAMPELAANRQEEADHVRPWISFAAGLGVAEGDLASYRGLPKTREAVSALGSLMDTFEGGACAMYAFEKEIPQISQTKLDGLAEFYGISDAASTEYFVLHTEADIRHAASWRGIIERAGGDQGRLLGAAAGSISAQNLLLDACYGEYCRAS